MHPQRQHLKKHCETLNAKLICGSQEDFNTTGKVVIAAASQEDLHAFIEPGDIVITGNRLDIQLKSIEYGTNCLIVTCGGNPHRNSLMKHEEKTPY